jgi:hypothetical protein
VVRVYTSAMRRFLTPWLLLLRKVSRTVAIYHVAYRMDGFDAFWRLVVVYGRSENCIETRHIRLTARPQCCCNARRGNTILE